MQNLLKAGVKVLANLRLFCKHLPANLTELQMPTSSNLSNSKEMLRLAKIERSEEELNLIIKSRIYGRVFQHLLLLKAGNFKGLKVGRKFTSL